jgi:hypothetical protein
MATRARQERGAVVKEQFEGRVRKWAKKWMPISDKKLARLQLLKWIQLGGCWVRCEARASAPAPPAHPGPRAAPPPPPRAGGGGAPAPPPPPRDRSQRRRPRPPRGRATRSSSR